MTGVIPQEITLDNDLTVRENLQVFAHFFAIPGAEASERIAELLKFVELENKRDSKIDQLSTGMKRRLLIARALLNEPRHHHRRRADHRPRPPGPPPDLAAAAAAEGPGRHPDPDHAVHGGGPAALRPHRGHAPGAHPEGGRPGAAHRGGDRPRGRRDPRRRPTRTRRLLAELGPLARGHERVGDTLYFYCDDGRPLMKKVLELDLPDTVHRPASLEDVFLKLTGRSLIE
ncbi:MAG: ATP-binding cassette domain-containing protein [Rhodopseudomonas palustris]|nr:ATP-binding cassette domain-containing protein [Rhodopseudomonas palustris]